MILNEARKGRRAGSERVKGTKRGEDGERKGRHSLPSEKRGDLERNGRVR